MRKAIVKDYLNIRTGTPQIRMDNNPGYYLPGDEIIISGEVLGDIYKGINTWFQLDTGVFVWSGGVTLPALTERKFDYRNAISGVPSAWMTTNGLRVKIAVLDTGFFLDHPDLVHLKNRCFIQDFGGNNNTADLQGHGTHILGLLAANSTFENGITGLCNEADFFLYKVIADDLGFLDVFAEAAILDAITKNVDIINMSFNVPSSENSGLHNAIKQAMNQNITVVASAGENSNLTENRLVFPAGYNGVISVGEVSQKFISQPVQLHSAVDLVMPFVEQKSCWISGSYKNEKGSSMATALVSGLLASALSTGGITDPFFELKNIAQPLSSSVLDDGKLKIIKP